MLQTFKLRQTLCLQQSGLETSRQLVPALSRLHGWLPCRMIHQLLGYFKNIRSVTSGDLHDLYCHWDISEKNIIIGHPTSHIPLAVTKFYI